MKTFSFFLLGFFELTANGKSQGTNSQENRM